MTLQIHGRLCYSDCGVSIGHRHLTWVFSVFSRIACIWRTFGGLYLDAHVWACVGDEFRHDSYLGKMKSWVNIEKNLPKKKSQTYPYKMRACHMYRVLVHSYGPLTAFFAPNYQTAWILMFVSQLLQLSFAVWFLFAHKKIHSAIGLEKVWSIIYLNPKRSFLLS